MICEKTVKKYCKDFTKIENYDKAMGRNQKGAVKAFRKALTDALYNPDSKFYKAFADVVSEPYLGFAPIHKEEVK